MPARTRLGVLGWPVAHSRSPQIHNAALRAAGLHDWRYQLLPVPAGLLAETIRALPGAGFRGANVTIPHKQAALAVADTASDSASAIGAANTLTFDGVTNAVHAENTDAPAIIQSLPFGAAGRTVLVLGAGGSARAAVWALLQEGAAEVRVWNRTPERARALCAELGGGTPVCVAEPAEILVHCTSSGLDASASRGLDASVSMFKGLPLSADDLGGYDCVVDLVYTENGTPLINAARERGAATVDGLELLVRQGALSFQLFTGVPAPVEAMHAAARGG
jgi:shikimate dehydrogenase